MPNIDFYLHFCFKMHVCRANLVFTFILAFISRFFLHSKPFALLGPLFMIFSSIFCFKLIFALGLCSPLLIYLASGLLFQIFLLLVALAAYRAAAALRASKRAFHRLRRAFALRSGLF